MRVPPVSSSSHSLPVALAVLLAGAVPVSARAADTTETWAPGAADVEIFFGTDGVGGEAASTTLFGDLLLGYGAAERLSLYLGTRLESDGNLARSAPGLRVGMFGTVVDTGVFDLDLALEAGFTGPGLSQLNVAPGAELNLDLGSPLGPWGLYLRAQVPIGGGGEALGAQLDLTPGVHWAAHEGHQVLVEYRASVLPEDGDGPWRWESSAVAVGYNVVLTETLELVSEISAGSLEQNPRFGAMVGLIATIP